jgi:hypothetical protein
VTALSQPQLTHIVQRRWEQHSASGITDRGWYALSIIYSSACCLGTSSTSETPKADPRTELGPPTSNSMPPPTAAPIKIVSIIDEHTRECLGGLAERCITGEDLINERDRNGP